MSPHLIRVATPWMASLTLMSIYAKHKPAKPWLLMAPRNDIRITPGDAA